MERVIIWVTIEPVEVTPEVPSVVESMVTISKGTRASMDSQRRREYLCVCV